MWDRLRSQRGRSTHYPPPRAENADPVALRDTLEEFFVHHERRFVKLFLHGKPLARRPEEQAQFDAFERAGLVTPKVPGLYLPCVRVFPIFGAMIATDLATHGAADQVFSLMFEQLYIAKRLGVRAGDRALELCVGSGVNSVFLSDTAASVTAVDISPRALDFARFNIALNPGQVGVELHHGSLFEPLQGRAPFDYILANPPFEPVPPGSDHFLHSHGGEDGLDVVREMLAALPAHLAPGGRFEMFTWSPGDDERAVVADLLRDAFPDRRIEIYRVDDRPIDERLKPFRSAKGYAAWRQRLLDAGYTTIWGVFTRVDSEGPAETAILEDPDEVDACVAIAREWA
jgi:SAM-dependent methyltransferase